VVLKFALEMVNSKNHHVKGDWCYGLGNISRQDPGWEGEMDMLVILNIGPLHEELIGSYMLMVTPQPLKPTC
jgi:hypothetical protein